ncbi:MAG: TrkH family potassium uptake protein [Pseudomonadota bacterium]
MNPKVIQKILGLLLSVFSLVLVPPFLISLWLKESTTTAFLLAIAATVGAGMALWLPVRKVNRELKLRDGFVIVVLFWLVLGVTGAIPFVLAQDMRVADAVFESVSGLTTTGATVIVGIESLPTSIQFYRHLLQWLGGMGIIVLAVAILPMLGVGGMQLYRAETPGPMKDSKLTPRITETAKALWYIYLSLTIACALAYYLAGMSFFDALCHSFSTVAIGGFSTHDNSLGYFDSVAIESVAIIFMFIAAINFSLHFLGWRFRNAKPYLYDSELRAFAALLMLVFLCCWLGLAVFYPQTSWLENLRHAMFQTISIGTTTGYTTTSFQAWPSFLPLVLLFMSFIGGCAGSTAGGIKVVRMLLLFKQGVREIKRLVHPSAIIVIRVGDRPISDRVVEAVWGFFAAYVAIFVLLMLAILATGLDQVTAFSAVAACLNNLGPGLGEVSYNYQNIPAAAKYLLAFAMLLGRLEIFTLLVLLSPTFWRS